MLPGGPGVFKERVQRSKELFLGVGGRSAGKAGREYFRIASAGQEQHAKMYSELTKKAVIEQPGIIAKNAAALNTGATASDNKVKFGLMRHATRPMNTRVRICFKGEMSRVSAIA